MSVITTIQRRSATVVPTSQVSKSFRALVKKTTESSLTSDMAVGGVQVCPEREWKVHLDRGEIL